MLTAKERQLLEALEPKAAESGIEVVTIEVVGAKKAPTIRVYLDKPEGIAFDDLMSAQAWVNAIVDAIDPFPGAYTLEVSSPGIDRPLRTPAHFARFAGEVAVVKTAQPIDGRSTWTGIISAVADDSVDILPEGADAPARIPLAGIKRARLKGTVDFAS